MCLQDGRSYSDVISRRLWVGRFGTRHDGKKLGNEPYIDYLLPELDRVADGESKRLVINLPPRHLKTFLAAVYLPAWVLAKDSSARIMVMTYSDQLAEYITYQIRRLLQSPWFKKVFKTRVAEDRSRVSDFATKHGGGVFATSVGGALAGHGADIPFLTIRSISRMPATSDRSTGQSAV